MTKNNTYASAAVRSTLGETLLMTAMVSFAPIALSAMMIISSL